MREAGSWGRGRDGKERRNGECADGCEGGVRKGRMGVTYLIASRVLDTVSVTDMLGLIRRVAERGGR